MPPTLTCGEHTCGGHTCGEHTCGGQFAHAPSRRRAVCAGRLVTRAAAHSASAARKSVRPVCLFAQSRTPAAAPGKSRTVSLSSPRLARTRLVPGVGPHRAPVFPGREKARGCAGQFAHRVCVFAQPRTHAHLRWASRAPGLCLRPAPHARAAAVSKTRTVFVAAFGPRTPAVLSGCKPTLSFYFPGRGKSPGASPTHGNA